MWRVAACVVCVVCVGASAACVPNWQLHPDKRGGTPEAQKEFIALVTAYETLKGGPVALALDCCLYFAMRMLGCAPPMLASSPVCTVGFFLRGAEDDARADYDFYLRNPNAR